MAAITLSDLRKAGLSSASVDRASFPGTFVMDFMLDGSKIAVDAADTVQMFELPAFAGVKIDAAAITVVRPGTATGTLALQLNGTSVTGLTAWAADAAAGTKLIKLGTAVNTLINTGTATHINLLQGVAALGSGLIRVRVFGTILEAPPSKV